MFNDFRQIIGCICQKMKHSSPLIRKLVYKNGIMGKEILLLIGVLATNAPDARRQANILVKDYQDAEILDVIPGHFSWDQIYSENHKAQLLDRGTLYEFKVIYCIHRL